jgi:hypothetical protein
MLMVIQVRRYAVCQMPLTEDRCVEKSERSWSLFDVTALSLFRWSCRCDFTGLYQFTNVSDRILVKNAAERCSKDYSRLEEFVAAFELLVLDFGGLDTVDDRQ